MNTYICQFRAYKSNKWSRTFLFGNTVNDAIAEFTEASKKILGNRKLYFKDIELYIP